MAHKDKTKKTGKHYGSHNSTRKRGKPSNMEKWSYITQRKDDRNDKVAKPKLPKLKK